MTELSPIATLLHPDEHVGEGRRKGRHRGAGRATLGCEVRIVDENDQPVPAESVGEIVVRGDTVMMGYWERPEETARAVVDGWMHTGDGGYMDQDGFIYVVDRVKDMIISGGENVYSVEVENALRAAPVGAAMRGDRSSQRAMGRAGPCRRGQARRRGGLTRRADRVHEDVDRRLQMSAQHRYHRDAAAAVRRRQGAEARAAQAVLGRPGPAGELRTCARVGPCSIASRRLVSCFRSRSGRYPSTEIHRENSVLVETRELKLDIERIGTVSALLTRPDHARACYVLAHGAGADMRHSFMEKVAAGLADRGIATFRFNFLHGKEAGRPDQPAVAHAAIRAAVADAARLCPGLKLVAGGKVVRLGA